MDEVLSSTIKGRRFRGRLFSAFGAVALIITATSVLAVVAMAHDERAKW
jgi:hypothetical protein